MGEATRLLLVRHARPLIRPEVDPRRWGLGEPGRGTAVTLATRLPTDAYLVASDEPKAWQTLAPAGAVVRDARFGEVRRDEPFDDDFAVRRRRYVEGAGDRDPALDGWETPGDVAARFGAAVHEHLGRAPGRQLVVGTHGMALTVWLRSTVGLPDPGRFWAALRFPDLLIVDLAAGTVCRHDGSNHDRLT